jgi:hypothetical protein
MMLAIHTEQFEKPRSGDAMASTAEDSSPTSKAAAPLVVHLGKKRRKLVRQLLKGKGKLLDEVGDAIAELKTAGAIEASAQPVIVVVRPKSRSWKLPFS